MPSLVTRPVRAFEAAGPLLLSAVTSLATLGTCLYYGIHPPWCCYDRGVYVASVFFTLFCMAGICALSILAILLQLRGSFKHAATLAISLPFIAGTQILLIFLSIGMRMGSIVVLEVIPWLTTAVMVFSCHAAINAVYVLQAVRFTEAMLED